MSSYYYLMASLPMLRSDGELPFSYEDFLEMCRSAVSGAKYTLLKELSLSSEKGPLVGEWAKFYTALERELIRLRNRRLGRQEQADGERDDAIAAAIAALPTRYREVLLLRYDNGFSYSEISKALDMTEAAVRKTVQRAKEALQRTLQIQEEDTDEDNR